MGKKNPSSFCLFISDRNQWGAQFKSEFPSQWVRTTHLSVVCRFHRAKRDSGFINIVNWPKNTQEENTFFFQFSMQKNYSGSPTSDSILHFTVYHKIYTTTTTNTFFLQKPYHNWLTGIFSVNKGGEKLKIHMWFRKWNIATGVFLFMSRWFTWICNLTGWSCHVLVMVTSCDNCNEDSPAQALWLSSAADFPALQRFFYMVTSTVSIIFNETSWFWRHTFDTFIDNMDINHRSDTAVVSWRATHGVAVLHRKTACSFTFLKQIYSLKILLKIFNVSFSVWNHWDTNTIVKPASVKSAQSSTSLSRVSHVVVVQVKIFSKDSLCLRPWSHAGQAHSTLYRSGRV